MYTIHFSPDAEGDLTLRRFEQKQVLDGVKDQLRYEPTVETRNRKQLDPNELVLQRNVGQLDPYLAVNASGEPPHTG
jgi:hypothetical protein